MNAYLNWLTGTASFDEMLTEIDAWDQKVNQRSNLSGSEITISIFVRSNINWGHVTMKQLQILQQSGKYQELLLKSIEMWNQNFECSYFKYRSFLQNLANLSWSRIRNVTSIIKNDYTYIDMLLNSGKFKKFIVIPTDDDDWFAPGISQAIEESFAATPDVDVFCWASANINKRGKLSVFSLGDPECHKAGDCRFHTNNYAITGTGLEKLARLGTKIDLLAIKSHAAAKKLFTENRSDFNIVDLNSPECLSIKNSSPASIMEIRKLGLGEISIGNFVKTVSRIQSDVPENMRWAQEYIDQMNLVKLQ